MINYPSLEIGRTEFHCLKNIVLDNISAPPLPLGVQRLDTLDAHNSPGQPSIPFRFFFRVKDSVGLRLTDDDEKLLATMRLKRLILDRVSRDKDSKMLFWASQVECLDETEHKSETLPYLLYPNPEAEHEKEEMRDLAKLLHAKSPVPASPPESSQIGYSSIKEGASQRDALTISRICFIFTPFQVERLYDILLFDSGTGIAKKTGDSPELEPSGTQETLDSHTFDVSVKFPTLVFVPASDAPEDPALVAFGNLNVGLDLKNQNIPLVKLSDFVIEGTTIEHVLSGAIYSTSETTAPVLNILPSFSLQGEINEDEVLEVQLSPVELRIGFHAIRMMMRIAKTASQIKFRTDPKPEQDSDVLVAGGGAGWGSTSIIFKSSMLKLSLLDDDGIDPFGDSNLERILWATADNITVDMQPSTKTTDISFHASAGLGNDSIRPLFRQPWNFACQVQQESGSPDRLCINVRAVSDLEVDLVDSDLKETLEAFNRWMEYAKSRSPISMAQTTSALSSLGSSAVESYATTAVEFRASYGSLHLHCFTNDDGNVNEVVHLCLSKLDVAASAIHKEILVKTSLSSVDAIVPFHSRVSQHSSDHSLFTSHPRTIRENGDESTGKENEQGGDLIEVTFSNAAKLTRPKLDLAFHQLFINWYCDGVSRIMGFLRRFTAPGSADGMLETVAEDASNREEAPMPEQPDSLEEQKEEPREEGDGVDIALSLNLLSLSMLAPQRKFLVDVAKAEMRNLQVALHLWNGEHYDVSGTVENLSLLDVKQREGECNHELLSTTPREADAAPTPVRFTAATEPAQPGAIRAMKIGMFLDIARVVYLHAPWSEAIDYLLEGLLPSLTTEPKKKPGVGPVQAALEPPESRVEISGSVAKAVIELPMARGHEAGITVSSGQIDISTRFHSLNVLQQLRQHFEEVEVSGMQLVDREFTKPTPSRKEKNDIQVSEYQIAISSLSVSAPNEAVCDSDETLRVSYLSAQGTDQELESLSPTTSSPQQTSAALGKFYRVMVASLQPLNLHITNKVYGLMRDIGEGNFGENFITLKGRQLVETFSTKEDAEDNRPSLPPGLPLWMRLEAPSLSVALLNPSDTSQKPFSSIQIKNLLLWRVGLAEGRATTIVDAKEIDMLDIRDPDEPRPVMVPLTPGSHSSHSWNDLLGTSQTTSALHDEAAQATSDLCQLHSAYYQKPDDSSFDVNINRVTFVPDPPFLKVLNEFLQYERGLPKRDADLGYAEPMEEEEMWDVSTRHKFPSIPSFSLKLFVTAMQVIVAGKDPLGSPRRLVVSTGGHGHITTRKKVKWQDVPYLDRGASAWKHLSLPQYEKEVSITGGVQNLAVTLEDRIRGAKTVLHPIDTFMTFSSDTSQLVTWDQLEQLFVWDKDPPFLFTLGSTNPWLRTRLSSKLELVLAKSVRVLLSYSDIMLMSAILNDWSELSSARHQADEEESITRERGSRHGSVDSVPLGGIVGEDKDLVSKSPGVYRLADSVPASETGLREDLDEPERIPVKKTGTGIEKQSAAAAVPHFDDYEVSDAESALALHCTYVPRFNVGGIFTIESNRVVAVSFRRCFNPSCESKNQGDS